MLSTENAVIEILPGSANDSTAAEVVVFPIPISPVPSPCIPSAWACAARAAPVRMARSACSRAMAAP